MKAIITAWSWDWQRRLGEKSIDVPDEQAVAALSQDQAAHLALHTGVCEAYAQSFRHERDVHTTITDRHIEDDEIAEVRAYYSLFGPHIEGWTP